jgi:hypothetical protein
MVVAVSAVSVFALDPEPTTYTASLLSPPPPAPTHVFTVFDTSDPAVVIVDGVLTQTVQIPLLDEINIKVYYGSTMIGNENGTVYGASTTTTGYAVSFDADSNSLLVTAPSDTAAADFTPAITFQMYVDAPGDHGPFTATLNLTEN